MPQAHRPPVIPVRRKKPPNWRVFDFPERQQKFIHHQWGQHYQRHGEFEAAIENYEKSKEIRDEREFCETLHDLGRTFLQKTEVEKAKKTLKGTKCKENHRNNLLECDILFDGNEFEKNLICTNNKKREVKDPSYKSYDFQERIDVTEEIFRHTIDDKAGDCLLEHRKIIPKLIFDSDIDPRPLWKQRRDQNQCDVMSVLDLQEKIPHLKDLQRKEQNTRFVSQVCLGPAWEDLFFLRDLPKHKAFILPQAKGSETPLKEIINESYSKAQKNLKMLHARNPIYTYKKIMFRSPELGAKTKEKNLFRDMYQNRRDAFTQLARVRRLRKEKNVEKLVNYTEKVLSEFYQTKSIKRFPRKFEFVTELCNIVALAFVEQLRIPPNLMVVPLRERMHLLFDVQMVQEKFDEIEYEFGNRSTYRDPLKVDTSFMSYKKKKTHLEQRLACVEYGIEEIYLLHEIARNDFLNDKLDDSKLFAGRCEQRAEEIGSFIYKFLAILMQLKADITATNVEKQSDQLKKLKSAVVPLKSEKLEHMIQVGMRLNELQLQSKHEEREIENENETNDDAEIEDEQTN
ncbi:uncharacterized protein LOC134833581 [Culicoides brevitarsis]|uniref:uncharacterized protein LOC134833581 n=1 Tax=Culicoides brevitarsis TaxID=469753 RepID=UPI00307B13CB